jgi:hypothetical protein
MSKEQSTAACHVSPIALLLEVPPVCVGPSDRGSIEKYQRWSAIFILATKRICRGRPKFEPTQDQRNQVKLMKALGIPEDRICKTITNPRTGKPVAPMTLARAFPAELESGAVIKRQADEFGRGPSSPVRQRNKRCHKGDVPASPYRRRIQVPFR